ncbi:MAG TPA: universal stress protein [Gaiellaceae bacterium]|nr:universal stress protein [Gaiellaceae bacterium]
MEPLSGFVVVGVDGSESSVAALRVAAEEASARDAKLHIVVAWHVPLAVYTDGLPPPPEVATDMKDAAEDIAKLAESKVPAGIEYEIMMREGQPQDVLVEESKGAEVLVVGSRGLGAFSRLVLGSVSEHVSHHATCPVVVVPPTDTDDREPAE